MKHKLFKAIAVLMALAMLAGVALTDEALEMPDGALDLETKENAGDLVIDEGGITKLENDTMLDNLGIDLTLGNFTQMSDVTYRFIVNEREYSFQVAHAGEEILCPVPPEAPKGKRFNGWKLADGTPLFVDADEDGKIDPVIARDYELGTEVYVWAEFADPSVSEQPAEEQPTEEQPAEEQPAEERPAEEPAEQPVEEEPAEEQPAEEEPAEEEPAEEEPAEEEPAEEESAEEQPVEEQPAEEQPAEEQPEAGESAEEPAGEEPVGEPMANELTYTGEAQALVSGKGEWLYSLDGEIYGEEIPTAVNAGEYTVYFKATEAAEPQTITVTVAKADAEFIPPVAAVE